jgi:hypothetical protein
MMWLLRSCRLVGDGDHEDAEADFVAGENEIARVSLQELTNRKAQPRRRPLSGFRSQSGGA